MKFYKLIIPVFALLIVSSSCTKLEPTACFGFRNNNNNDTVYTAFEEISFYDCSLNAERYSWNFGDGTTSTSENPLHTYLQGGTYTVTHEVFSEDGKLSDIISSEIEVESYPLNSIKINTLEMHNYPQFDSTGNYWDSSWDGPDVFFRIIETNSTNIVYENFDVEDDCYLNTTYSYSVYEPLLPIQSYTIEFLDYDWPFGHIMGSVEFSPADHIASGLPTSIPLTGDGFDITLDVDWNE